MDAINNFEGNSDRSIQDVPKIIRWVVTVETGGISVDKEFTTEEEANDYCKTESENPNALCSIKEVEEVVTPE